MLYTQITVSFLVKYHLESRTMLQAQGCKHKLMKQKWRPEVATSYADISIVDNITKYDFHRFPERQNESHKYRLIPLHQ